MHSQVGMGRPGWFPPIHFLSKIYVDVGLLYDIRNAARYRGSAPTREFITLGILGSSALNQSKLEAECRWSATHIMMGFEINSESLQIPLPGAKISGDRVLADYLEENKGPVPLNR